MQSTIAYSHWRVVNISAVENGIDFASVPLRQLLAVSIGADAERDYMENRRAAKSAVAADSYGPH